MLRRLFSQLRNKFKGLFLYLKTSEIRKKILYTIAAVVVFRVLASIPLPGINAKVYVLSVGSNTGSAFTSLLTLATGGRIDTPSLVAIGIGAYINASIAIQLLTSVIPKLEELEKEGESGRRLINQITRILTVPLSVLQGFVVYALLQQNSQPLYETVVQNGKSVSQNSGFVISDMVSKMSRSDIIIMMLAITAGSVILMWLSELITENGIGNGSSIIIMVGILSSLPGFVATDFSKTLPFVFKQLSLGNFGVLFTNGSMIFIYIFIIGVIAIVALIVYVEEAIRKIIVQYARRVRDNKTVQSSYLPLKINQSGVMPIIFASALLTFPSIIGQVLIKVMNPSSKIYDIVTQVLAWPIFQYQRVEYIIFYFTLIIVFTFFYAFIVMKPEDTADNLKKSGGFIPGIRPGKATSQYITHVMFHLATIGALFLGLIAVLPNIVRLTEQGANLTVLVSIGGSSLLIIVSVIIDTYRQIKSLQVTKNYEIYK